MNKQTELCRPLVISASRTRDMVHRSPGLLARILLGDAPCRWGPRGAEARIDPAVVHSVVLWTKDVANLLTHAELRGALHTLIERYGVLISLGFTVTGMGGTFMEPAIPHWRKAAADLRALLAERWVDPRAVIYRYDPFVAVRTPAGHRFSNATPDSFRTVSEPILALGIARVTTSRGDAVHYPRVAERMAEFGLQWLHIEDGPAVELCRAMGACCRSRGVDFSVCCEPFASGLMDNWGCIDGSWLSLLKEPGTERATAALHNQLGKQRLACRCTYSRDIGYSTGSATCFSGGYGCLYCYAQGHARVEPAAVRADIADYDRSPRDYLCTRDLPDFSG